MRTLGYMLQVAGLVVTLGALFWFGFKPRMGPMMYTALGGAGLFYSGTMLLRRKL